MLLQAPTINAKAGYLVLYGERQIGLCAFISQVDVEIAYILIWSHCAAFVCCCYLTLQKQKYVFHT